MKRTAAPRWGVAQVGSVSDLQDALQSDRPFEIKHDFSIGDDFLPSACNLALDFLEKKQTLGPVPWRQHVILRSVNRQLLRILSMQHCLVKHFTLQFLNASWLPFFSPNKNVREITFCGNGDSVWLANLLNITNLEKLSLVNVSMDNDLTFLKALSCSKYLRELQLNNCSFTTPAGPYLGSYVEKLTVVVSNMTDAYGFIKGNFLKEFALFYSSHIIGLITRMVGTLFKEMSYNQTLEKCSLHTSEYLESFDSFQNNSSLRYLTVPATISSIHKLFQRPSRITHLKVNLSPEVDSNIFLDFVKIATGLLSLEILGKDTWSPHANQIFSSILNNTSLQHVGINYFSIDDECAKIIATMVNEPGRLKSLKIENNKISDKGYETIFNSLPGNTTLTTLSFTIEEECPDVSSLIAYLRQTSKLKILTFRGDRFAWQVYNALVNNLLVEVNYNAEYEHDVHQLLTNLSSQNKGLILTFLFLFLDISEKIGWPSTHEKFKENDKKIWLELSCCSCSLPTEVLSLIVHQIFIIQTRQNTTNL